MIQHHGKSVRSGETASSLTPCVTQKKRFDLAALVSECPLEIKSD